MLDSPEEAQDMKLSLAVLATVVVLVAVALMSTTGRAIVPADMLTTTCIAGFSSPLSTTPKEVWKCSSVPIACPAGYAWMHNQPSFFGGAATINTGYDPGQNRFYYSCAKAGPPVVPK
jgi:hypothetical protein